MVFLLKRGGGGIARIERGEEGKGKRARMHVREMRIETVDAGGIVSEEKREEDMQMLNV